MDDEVHWDDENRRQMLQTVRHKNYYRRSWPVCSFRSILVQFATERSANEQLAIGERNDYLASLVAVNSTIMHSNHDPEQREKLHFRLPS